MECSDGEIKDCDGNCVSQALVQSYTSDGYCDDPAISTDECWQQEEKDTIQAEQYYCNVTLSRCLNGEIYLSEEESSDGAGAIGTSDGDLVAVTLGQFEEYVNGWCLQDFQECMNNAGATFADGAVGAIAADGTDGVSSNRGGKSRGPSNTLIRAVGYNEEVSDGGSIYIKFKSRSAVSATTTTTTAPLADNSADFSDALDSPVPFAVNLNCAAFEFDGGDCGPQSCDQIYWCEDAGTGSPGILDCMFNVCMTNKTAMSRIGDGHCDLPGSLTSLDEPDLICPRFNFDGGDCLRERSTDSRVAVARVTLAGMTAAEFDTEAFARGVAMALDLDPADVTGIAVEEVASATRRRALSATDLIVTFTIMAPAGTTKDEVQTRISNVVSDGSLEMKLKEQGITAFSAIKDAVVTGASNAPTTAPPPPTTTTTTTTMTTTTTTTTSTTSATMTTAAATITSSTRAPSSASSSGISLIAFALPLALGA